MKIKKNQELRCLHFQLNKTVFSRRYLLLRIYHDMKSLLLEWPLVHVEQYLLCSHCILQGDNDPYLYPAELYLETVCPQKTYQLQSCQKSKETYIPACLVVPLDAG